MIQSLEFKRAGEALGTDGRILVLLENGSVPIEQLASLEGVFQGEAMSSVARLIAAGEARLVVAQFVWGVEFRLERVCS
jgi:poly-gamma-glutamate capsule biosynthesis protein CapA/YwtB (metallophosphatase superfamily)